jgi:hypothetical protein
MRRVALKGKSSTKQKSHWNATVLVAAVLYILLGTALIVLAPPLIVDFEQAGRSGTGGINDAARANLVTSTRQSVLLGLGGILALIGVVLSYHRQRLDERIESQRKTEHDHAAAQDKADLDLRVDENRTSRYTAAIGQLADDAIDVQLGGVYALQRLARDSAQDAPVIAQVFVSSLRRRGTARQRSLVEAGDDRRSVVSSLPVEMAIADYLRENRIEGVYLPYIDFSENDLRHWILPKADLSGCVFDKANMQGVDLTGANLTNVTFYSTDLRGAILDETVLSGVDPTFANIRDTSFRGANLNYTSWDVGPTDYGAREMPDFSLTYWYDEPGWPSGLREWARAVHYVDGMYARLPDIYPRP